MSKSRTGLVLISVLLFPLLFSYAAAGELPAQLDWAKRLVLSTTVSGIVDKVAVVPGQHVSKGTTLVALDAREFKAARQQALAKLHASKVTLDEAKRELTRSKDLFERTMISDHDLQLVKNSEAEARAAYLGAKAQLQEAEIALERSRIQAPYDCVVLSIPAQVGQTVISNLKAEPLAVIAEADHMMARAWLASADISKYAGQKAQAVKVGGQTFTAISQQLVLEPNNKGQYALQVIFDMGKHSLHPGQAATIVFP